MKELSEILQKPIPACADIHQWKVSQTYRPTTRPVSTLKEAFLAGCRSDRMAWAFSSGYQWAIRSMIPDLVESTDVISMCITESGGGHPRQILSSLEPSSKGYILSGEKKLISCGTEADLLLVGATTGMQDNGRPALKMCLCPAKAEGVSIEPMQGLQLVPELPHASITFSKVKIPESKMLPGDGYVEYIRPFRMHEDLHLQAALAGMVVRKTHDLQQPELMEKALACFYTLQGIKMYGEDPADALALGAMESWFKDFVDSVIELIPDQNERAAWQRDSRVLNIAGKARAVRRHNAREKVAA